VDGKPFFPLGMYWGSVNEADLVLFSKTAFNCLMSYNPPDDTATMDMIDRHGLKILYSVKDIFHGIHGCPKDITTEAEEQAFIQRKTERFKGHPALLAWYINDELPSTMMERLDGRQRLMEELDPDHPTWVVLYQYHEISRYLNSFDVIGTDPYPVPGDLGEAGVQARAVRQQTNGQRAMWQVPQAFDWACYRDTEEARSKTRPPTEEEMRAMSWMAIVNGANGLVYYSFFDLKRPVVKIPFEESFGRVCRVAEEIKRFVPVILSIEAAPQVKVVKGGIDVRVWSHEGRTYLLTVNGKKTAVNAQVSVNKGFADASNVLGTQGGVTWKGTVLDLEFAPYEAKMIVLQ
jgi:hypothetical protein